MSDAAKVVGLWSLVGYTRTDASGVETRPFGASPVGRLLYTPDGYMSAHIMPGGEGAEGEPPVSKVAYCGAWKVVESEVFHDVLVGSNTIATGTTVSRRVGWQGDDLILSADGWQQGETLGHRALHWTRVT